jgi:hypothetical protein
MGCGQENGSAHSSVLTQRNNGNEVNLNAGICLSAESAKNEKSSLLQSHLPSLNWSWRGSRSAGALVLCLLCRTRHSSERTKSRTKEGLATVFSLHKGMKYELQLQAEHTALNQHLHGKNRYPKKATKTHAIRRVRGRLRRTSVLLWETSYRWG